MNFFLFSCLAAYAAISLVYAAEEVECGPENPCGEGYFCCNMLQPHPGGMPPPPPPRNNRNKHRPSRFGGFGDRPPPPPSDDNGNWPRPPSSGGPPSFDNMEGWPQPPTGSGKRDMWRPQPSGGMGGRGPWFKPGGPMGMRPPTKATCVPIRLNSTCSKCYDDFAVRMTTTVRPSTDESVSDSSSTDSSSIDSSSTDSSSTESGQMNVPGWKPPHLKLPFRLECGDNLTCDKGTMTCVEITTTDTPSTTTAVVPDAEA